MYATKQCFPVVLFIILFKVVPARVILKCTIHEMKAIEQYSPVVLLIMLYKFVDETAKDSPVQMKATDHEQSYSKDIQSLSINTGVSFY